jgi:hypothetical protein
MEHLTFEDIFKRFDSMDGLGEFLYHPHDYYDLGYMDFDTQVRITALHDQSFLTICSLWQYFNGTDVNKVNHQHTYDYILEHEKQIAIELQPLKEMVEGNGQ